MAEPSDAIEVLTRDHRVMTGLLEQLDQEDDAAAQAALLEQIVEVLAAHEAAENEVVFPAFRSVLPSEEREALARLAEHEEVNELVAEMQELDPNGLGFAKRSCALGLELRAHFEAEEETLFPHLREALDPAELSELRTQVEAAKRQASLPGHRAALRA